MRQLILGIGAVSFLSAGGLVVAQTAHHRTATETAAASDDPAPTYLSTYTLRLAAADTSTDSFRKLDTDNDGRISALEAAANPRVAAAFTAGDKDKDGFLSKEEFEALGRASPRSVSTDASSPDGDRVSDPGGDRDATSP